MNNSRVGIEEFHSGKNIEISNHLFNLTDNVNISGNLVVDLDASVNGTILANIIYTDYLEAVDSKILHLDNIDISTDFINSNSLSINSNSFSINVNDLSIDSSSITISAEYIYFNDNMVLIKNRTRTNNLDLANIFEETVEVLQIDNLEIVNSLKIPKTVISEVSVSGEFTAETDLNVKGVLYSNLRLVTYGTNTLNGTTTLNGPNTLNETTTLNGQNTLNGTTTIVKGTFQDISISNLVITGSITIPNTVLTNIAISGEFTAENDLIVKGTLKPESSMITTGPNTLNGTTTLNGQNTLNGTTTILNGTFEDISISRLSITSECDVSIKNGGVFRIHEGFGLSMVNIYDWLSDISNNLYYDRGNIVIGSIVDNTIDASLNVHGSVDIFGDLDVTGTIITGTNLSSSDIRLKTNIRDLTNGIDIIRKIKPKIYDKTFGNGVIKESGVIAQDILEINELKHLVHKHKDMYSMNYNSLHMYSLLGIQELDKKITQIEQHLSMINQKLNMLYKMRR